MRHLLTLLVVFFYLCFFPNLFGQDTYSDTLNCSGGTPTFIVDLSSDIDSVWISDPTERGGECCIPVDDNCVQFTVTLPPEAGGLIFSIPDGCGAVPSGALFYQVDCGDVTSVGEPLCLDGVGPYVITFCKPGSNENCYSIVPIAEPETTTDITITDACVDSISVTGMEEETIVWTSVSPGLPGEYDGLLSCTMGCDTVEVTTTPGVIYPSTILYQVCGNSIGGCAGTPYCDTVSVTIVPDLDVEITPLEPSICFGEANTTITANVSGGLAPYNYFWSTGESSASILVGVGTFYVDVTDATGCIIAADTVTVTEYLDVIEANAGNDIYICEAPIPTVMLDGSVTGTTTGGWIGGGGIFVPDTSDLSASYTPSAAELLAGFAELILVTTNNGSCPPDQDTVNLFFTNFNTVLDTTITDVSCFGTLTGEIDLIAVGGALPLTYTWDSGEVTEDLIGIGAGTYICEVIDTNSCVSNIVVEIVESPMLELDFSVTDVSCFMGSDGEIDALVTGGTPPYGYLWDSGEISEDLTGMSSGVFTLTVTDANGCEIIGMATINQPDEIILTTAVNNVSCFGFLDGAIDVAVTGGILPLTYSWDSGEITEDISGMGAGIFELTVLDASGCDAVETAEITEPMPLNISAEVIDISCFGLLDGIIDLSVTGGTPTYDYSWDSGETTEDLMGLPVGIYAITVIDISGCEENAVFEITEPELFEVVLNPTDVSCFDGTDGEVDAVASGGVMPYSFDWDTGEATEDLIGLSAGDYLLNASDSNGCISIASVTVSEPDVLSLDLVATDESCIDEADGIIDLTVTGGTPEYSCIWSTFETTEDVSDLTAGWYNVVVTDENGCIAIDSAFIMAPEDYTAGEDSLVLVCVNDPAIDLNELLTATTVGVWSEVTSSGQFNTATGTLDLSDLPAGDYIFNYTIPEFTPCTDIVAIFSVTVYPLPNVNFTADIVSGCHTLGVNFTNLTDLTGGGCTWELGDGSIVEGCEDFYFFYDEVGSFDVTLTVTSDVGCINSFTASDFILVEEGPIADFTYSPEEITIHNTTVNFNNFSINSDTYEWFFDDGGISSDEHPIYTFPEIGNQSYEVILVAKNNIGCTDTARQIILINDVLILYVPNVFTPDGDSFNESFTPVITAGVDVYNYHLIIFNRWGEVIFESFDSTVGWDGTYKEGGLVLDDVYIWKIDFKETMSDKRHFYNGHVTILK